MAYVESKPEKHYTLFVKVVEVTPAYSTGSGVTTRTVDRSTEDVMTLSVRGKDIDEAIERAIEQLKTLADGIVTE